MSAPETNVKKQAKRHRPALWGMIIGGVFVAVILLAYLANLAARGNNPGEESNAIRGTGEVESTVEAEE